MGGVPHNSATLNTPVLVPSLYDLWFPRYGQNKFFFTGYAHFLTSYGDGGGTVGKPVPDNGGVGVGSESLTLMDQELFEEM